MNVIMNIVSPYIILGAMFGKSAGGQTLIKLAFRWTRHMRGGSTHAAMFGTITGGPVVNVMSTGVLTIPMMMKRRFSKMLACGMEAAASSGGSIMPPVTSVAAMIFAAMTAVPYGDVIVAVAPVASLTMLDCHINDAAFADAALAVLDGWIADETVSATR